MSHTLPLAEFGAPPHGGNLSGIRPAGREFAMKTEEWRPVVGYEGFYEVSDEGRVKRLASQKSKRGPSVRVERILSTPIDSVGYRCVALCVGAQPRHTRVHVLVAAAFIGPRPHGVRDINHKDGAKTNNRSPNLEYVSHADNVRHAIKIGMFDPEDKSNRCALTARQIRRIRRVYAATKPRCGRMALSREYGVSHATIFRIANGIARKSVK